MTPVQRFLLLLTGLLAAYQVAVGVEGLETLPVIAYTIAFGVLLVAGLLLIILGFEALDSPVVVSVATIIPLSLSLGLAWQHLPGWRTIYPVFVAAGFLAVVISRSVSWRGPGPTIILALVHGVAGLVIFLLPISMALSDRAHALYSLVGLGGALIGLGGLLLSFLKAGRPILSRETILKVLPGLLLLMTLCFVLGFHFG